MPPDAFDAARYLPLMAAGQRIGWVRPQLAARLAAWPEVFSVSEKDVELRKADMLSLVVEQLAREGFIPGWRNERYRIADLFEVERAAARPFGFATQAVHVNGVVPGRGMWLARRSPTKPIDPGMLDNLVGGGMTAGLTREQVLVKEAWEEAGIPAELARRAVPAGTLQVLREVPEGVQSEVVHVYDLELPVDFAPRNQDGEVAEFLLLPLHAIPEQGLTFEAVLVARDYVRRAAALNSLDSQL
jgi:8-oxo-dGTP pyrophosphatase MutT (NUDIX family)